MQIPRLLEWRERRALTQVELAERAGVSERSVAGYEAGSGARPPTVRRLAEALDIEVTDLFGDPERPLTEAPPSQEKLFNNGVLEEERRLRYLRALDSFAARRNKYWALRAERNEFSEEQFQEEVDTFSDFEDAFVTGIGIDLLATFRDAGYAVPASERDAFQSAQASKEAWYKTLWRAYDALRERGAANVERLDEHRAHLERAESGRRSA